MVTGLAMDIYGIADLVTKAVGAGFIIPNEYFEELAC
jgi:hypothetical protein